MDKYAQGGFMQTNGSRWVSLLEPLEDMIHLDDIIAASNRIRRFAGHSNVTLAMHSCLVHDIAQSYLMEKDKLALRAALMHDAHEVYVVDVPSPLKAAMRTASAGPSVYDLLEDRMAEVVASKFGFPFPLPPVVKLADSLALAIEADHTWGKGTAERWGYPRPIKPWQYVNLDLADNDIWARLDATKDEAISLGPARSTDHVPAPQLERTDVAQQGFEGRLG